MQVSVDGIGEQYNRAKRYQGVDGDPFSIIVENIERVLESGISVHLRINYRSTDRKSIEEGFAFFNERFGSYDNLSLYGAPLDLPAEKGYSGILRNIRRANDRIADPILSAKIDRLEEITARIFRAVEEDPQKRPRIDTFLNYYLPTTQKLLDSYAEFEAAGVEGENLSQAKQRIENTMDAIVRGFEHQLDELYKADALDVDSDIRVMESMLRRDTASVEQDFGQPAKPPAGEN